MGIADPPHDDEPRDNADLLRRISALEAEISTLRQLAKADHRDAAQAAVRHEEAISRNWTDLHRSRTDTRMAEQATRDARQDAADAVVMAPPAGGLQPDAMTTREVSHRVKNSLQLIVSLLQMQAMTSTDPILRGALGDAAARVMTIAQIHNRLWRQDRTDLVDLAPFLGELCEDLQQSSPDCHLSYGAPTIVVQTEVAISLGLMVNELVTNAFKHGCPGGKGTVTVTVAQPSPTRLQLKISDAGPGLPANFDSHGRPGSLGMRLVHGMVDQLQGTLDIRSADPGASFTIDIGLQ